MEFNDQRSSLQPSRSVRILELFAKTFEIFQENAYPPTAPSFSFTALSLESRNFLFLDPLE
jgi:hypothetical protein